MGAAVPKIFRFSFLITLVLFPLFFGSVFLWSFSISAAILSAVFAIYFLISRGSAEPSVVSTSLDGRIVLYVLFFGASCFFSQIPVRTSQDIFKLSTIFLVFISTVAYCRKRQDIQRLVMVAALLGGIFSLLGLLQYLGGFPKGWWARKDLLSSVYVNHNHFAGFLELVLPVSLALSLVEKDNAKKTLLVFLCVLMGLAFVLTLSRSGYVGLVSGFVVMIVILLKRNISRGAPWIVALLVLAVSGFVAVFGFEAIVSRFENLKEVLSEERPTDRIFIWKAALDIIRHYPWFGSGPGTFEFTVLKFRPAEIPHWRFVHAHNDYLHLAADCGVFVLSAAAVLFWAVLGKAWRLTKSESRFNTAISAGILAGFVSILIHSLTDFNFHIPANFAYAGLLAGILFSLEPKEKSPSFFSRVFRGILVPCLLLISIAGSIFFGISDYFLWTARQAANRGYYPAALGLLNRSLRINAYNDETYFLRGHVLSKKEGNLQALADFKRARELNPFEPYYDLYEARELLLLKQDKKTLDDAVLLYEAAFSKDPNAVESYFMASRELYSANVLRDKSIEKRAKEMLMKVFLTDEGYSAAIYEILWGYYKDVRIFDEFVDRSPAGLEKFVKFLEQKELWKYHRKYYLKSVGVDPWKDLNDTRNVSWSPLSDGLWTLKDFKEKDGWEAYSGNIFFANGELQKKTIFQGGPVRLLLRVKGSAVAKVYPYVVVTLDGKTVDSIYLNSSQFANFYSVFKTTPGEHTLGIRYVNDGADRRSKEDRNIWIDRIELQYPKLSF